MGTGWRRAFCTSARRDSPSPSAENQSIPSPRSYTKFGGFFSNPSTPRLQQPESAASTPTLRCRTRSPPPPPPPPPPAAPKLQCKTRPNPCTPPSSNTRLFRASSPNPSSPISPSRFSLFKASLRLSRNRCGICAQSVKRGQGTAVFTAECSHSFHFPCISSHIRSHGCLVCPVCSAVWRQASFLSSIHQNSSAPDPEQGNGEHSRRNRDDRACKPNKLYDDDEPLLVSGGGAGSRFIPIPEEADDDDEDVEFQGFSVAQSPPPLHPPTFVASAGGGGVLGVDVSVMPVVALVARGRSHQNYVVALKVRAPPTASSSFPSPSHRAPIDLVIVLDVSDSMTGPKLGMLKRAMRLLISSLGAADRLALVGFSSSAKRLLPLRRMTPQGQRAARHIIDRLVISGNHGQNTRCVGEALRKATRVLEDRRERNPVATVMLLSDGQQADENKEKRHQRHQRHLHTSAGARPSSVPTRFAHLEIPIHDSGFGDAPKQDQQQQQFLNYNSSSEDSFAKCVGGLLSVVLQDVHLQLLFPLGEVSAVYSCGGGGERAVSLGAGSSIRLGDLYAEEERELLVELRVPSAVTANAIHHMSVKCSYRDTSTQELIRSGERHLQLPPLQPRPSNNADDQLRNLFVTTRAIAESRRLAQLNDHGTAVHLLTSARSLLLQCASISASPTDNESLLRSLEAELADIQLRRHDQQQQQQLQLSLSQRRRRERRESTPPASSDGGEPLTPTSAWRAAERLAKVAIMRKSLNRVSDLHGFENARF
ncbi:hypothetical protein J5N97_026644 [Dioscorea zingiberensis]|uniref:Uncharacterized protein n=1 Tax=Dioscorea zingiberensis TaxID=325984 RepID=A0A9D5H6V0_9LILI|nr:hypothetical protein J5N97_026644 [Dioscorea zingiberensis]